MSIVLQVAGSVVTLFGLLLILLCVRPVVGKYAHLIDKSNRWNRLIGVVYVAMHPEVFGNIQFFKNDVGDNIKAVEEAMKGKGGMQSELIRNPPENKE